MRRVSRAQTHTRRLRSDDFIKPSQSHTHCFHYNTNVNMCAHRQSRIVRFFPCLGHALIKLLYLFTFILSFMAYGYLDKVVRLLSNGMLVVGARGHGRNDAQRGGRVSQMPNFTHLTHLHTVAGLNGCRSRITCNRIHCRRTFFRTTEEWIWTEFRLCSPNRFISSTQIIRLSCSFYNKAFAK